MTRRQFYILAVYVEYAEKDNYAELTQDYVIRRISVNLKQVNNIQVQDHCRDVGMDEQMTFP